MRKAWLCAIVLTAALIPARGQTPEEDLALVRRGIACVYNLEFENAQKDFQELTRRNPGDPAGYFFQAMVRWWMIMIDIDDTQYDAEFYAALDGVVAMCDSLLDRNRDDANALFFKGGAIGFEGRLKFHRNDYLGAANAGRKALPLVQQLQDIDPSNCDVLLGEGIYNYYADVIPGEYPFVKPLLLFLPPGDKQKGLAQLKTASEKGKYAAVEAEYFLLQIEYFYEKDYNQSLALSLDLHGKFPANMVFHRYCGRSYVALNNWDMARSQFAEIIERSRDAKRGYTPAVEREAQYYCGMAALTGRRFDEALVFFYRCDEISRALDKDEASGFMSMANLRIGMVYDVQGKRDLATAQYRKVLAMANYQDSRALAGKYLETPYVH